MAKKIAEYKKIIERALRAAGKYSKSLDIQVDSLAGLLRTHGMVNDTIDGLESVTVRVKNRYGGESDAPHPVFRIQKDTQDAVTRQMKALGLTAEELSGIDENDPLVDLTKKVKSAKRKRVVISPDAEPEPETDADGAPHGS